MAFEAALSECLPCGAVPVLLLRKKTIRTLRILSIFNVHCSACRCLVYNKNCAVGSVMYVLPDILPQRKQATNQIDGCQSVDASRGCLVRGMLVVGPPTFRDVVECPLMPRLLAPTATVHPATLICHERISCNLIDHPYFLFVASNFREWTNCGLTDEDVPDIKTCFDGVGRSDMFLMYVSLLLECGQACRHH